MPIGMTATEATALTARNRQLEAERRAVSTDKTADAILEGVERSIRAGGHPALRTFGPYMNDPGVRAAVDRRLTAAGFSVSSASHHDVEWPGKYARDTFGK
jgi:hypothetical protein